MIDVDGGEIKYSVLMSLRRGSSGIFIDHVAKMLREGVKVILFMPPDDETEEYHKRYHGYIKEHLLCIYTGNGEQLKIVDGRYGEKEREALKRLAATDPRFNLQQYEIEHDDTTDYMVVQAGAGSGKTFVLTERIMYLMHTRDDLRFSDIVMITFTNKATDSMRAKLMALLNARFMLTRKLKYLQWAEEISQLTISTIHSFFKKVIVEVGPLMGYGTGLQLKSMVGQKREILKDILNERYGASTAKVEDKLGMTFYDAEKLALEYWRKLENNGMSERDVSDMDWGVAEGDGEKIQGTLLTIFREVEKRYEKIKRESHAIAMGDIIHEFGRIVDEPKVREYITSRYKYIFCDEFQDSDDVQIRTIAILDRIYGGKLFVVGDIKQSIYRFRGATDTAFKTMDRNMEAERGGQIRRRVMTLTKNYRTSGHILTAIDPIFRKWSDNRILEYRYLGEENDVLTAQVKTPGIYRQIPIYGKGEEKEAFYRILDEIREREEKNASSDDIQTESTRPGGGRSTKRQIPQKPAEGKKPEIVVLTRINAQLQQVKKWCEERKIPCVIRERGTFYRSPAVLEFTALIEGLLYQKEPMYIYNMVIPLTTEPESYVNQLLGDGSKEETEKKFIAELGQTWEKWQKGLRTRPLMSVLGEIDREMCLAQTYMRRRAGHYLNTKHYSAQDAMKQAEIDAKRYDADLQKLLGILGENFGGETATLYDMAKFLRIKIATDTDEERAEIGEMDLTGCVQGSTVHAAKGLEYEYVIIPFTGYPFFNNKRSEILIDKDRRKVGWRYKNGDKACENRYYRELSQAEKDATTREETRLLYVAMTRAKKGLYCVTARSKQAKATDTWAGLLPEGRDDA